MPRCPFLKIIVGTNLRLRTPPSNDTTIDSKMRYTSQQLSYESETSGYASDNSESISNISPINVNAEGKINKLLTEEGQDSNYKGKYVSEGDIFYDALEDINVTDLNAPNISNIQEQSSLSCYTNNHNTTISLIFKLADLLYNNKRIRIELSSNIGQESIKIFINNTGSYIHIDKKSSSVEICKSLNKLLENPILNNNNLEKSIATIIGDVKLPIFIDYKSKILRLLPMSDMEHDIAKELEIYNKYSSNLKEASLYGKIIKDYSINKIQKNNSKTVDRKKDLLAEHDIKNFVKHFTKPKDTLLFYKNIALGKMHLVINDKLISFNKDNDIHEFIENVNNLKNECLIKKACEVARATNIPVFLSKDTQTNSKNIEANLSTGISNAKEHEIRVCHLNKDYFELISNITCKNIEKKGVATKEFAKNIDYISRQYKNMVHEDFSKSNLLPSTKLEMITNKIKKYIDEFPVELYPLIDEYEKFTSIITKIKNSEISTLLDVNSIKNVIANNIINFLEKAVDINEILTNDSGINYDNCLKEKGLGPLSAKKELYSASKYLNSIERNISNILKDTSVDDIFKDNIKYLFSKQEMLEAKIQIREQCHVNISLNNDDPKNIADELNRCIGSNLSEPDTFQVIKDISSILARYGIPIEYSNDKFEVMPDKKYFFIMEQYKNICNDLNILVNKNESISSMARKIKNERYKNKDNVDSNIVSEKLVDDIIENEIDSNLKGYDKDVFLKKPKYMQEIVEICTHKLLSIDNNFKDKGVYINRDYLSEVLNDYKCIIVQRKMSVACDKTYKRYKLYTKMSIPFKTVSIGVITSTIGGLATALGISMFGASMSITTAGMGFVLSGIGSIPVVITMLIVALKFIKAPNKGDRHAKEFDAYLRANKYIDERKLQYGILSKRFWNIFIQKIRNTTRINSKL